MADKISFYGEIQDRGGGLDLVYSAPETLPMVLPVMLSFQLQNTLTQSDFRVCEHI